MSNKSISTSFKAYRLKNLLNDYELLEKVKDGSGQDEYSYRHYAFTGQGKVYKGILHGKITNVLLSKAINYSEGRIRQCLNTECITVEMLDSICSFLNVSPDYLKGKSDNHITDFKEYVSSGFYDMGYYSNYEEAIEDAKSDYNDELERAKKASRIDQEGIYIPEYSDMRYGHFNDQIASLLVEYMMILLHEKTFSKDQINNLLPFIGMYQQRVIDELYSVTKDVIHLIEIGDYITGSELLRRKEEQDNGEKEN